MRHDLSDYPLIRKSFTGPLLLRNLSPHYKAIEFTTRPLKSLYRVYSGLIVPQLTSERFLNPPEYFVWISEDYLDPITKTRKVNVRTAVLTTDL